MSNLSNIDNGEIKKPELTLEIIKRYICPSATDSECYMFLQLCKAQELNPFLREAYLIKYGTSPATIVTGKETFTKRADKLPQYDGFKAGIIVLTGDKISYREGGFYTSSETILGGWAEVYRKDRAIPFRNEVKLEEYEGKKADGTPTRMWAEKRATMIRKVAIVQSLREAFPDAFGGLYSPEEINTVGELPNYEIGKPPIVAPPEKPKMPQSKSESEQEKFKSIVPGANMGVETQEVITNIIKTSVKSGINKTTGAEFKRYTILGDNEIIYSTFDENIATLARTCKDVGMKAKIVHEGGKYNNIVSIDIDEPSKTDDNDVNDFSDIADEALREAGL